MYTRCPNCQSTFRLNATLLQMAGGDVRCGACGAVFNALGFLYDELPAADAAAASSQAPAPAPERPPPAAAADVPEEMFEFNAPQGDWQRFFVAAEEALPAAPQRTEPGLGADFEVAIAEEIDIEPGDAIADAMGDAVSAPDDLSAEEPADSLEQETSDTDTWQAFLREAEPDPKETAAPLYVIGEADADDAPAPVLVRRETAPPLATLAPTEEPAAQAASSKVPEDDVLDEEETLELAPSPGHESSGDNAGGEKRPETILVWEPPPQFSTAAARPPRHTGRWFFASLVAALMLAAQVAHYNRDTLAADPSYGGLVRLAYQSMDQVLYPQWPLDAFEIRDAKAIAENSRPGALDMHAEIAVTGRQPVGLPLVRVVLRDRWANILASGTFQPEQYLAEDPPASGLYAPGTLIPVSIVLKDPGTTAQGYELDVCVPNRRLGLQCRAARDPFRR